MIEVETVENRFGLFDNIPLGVCILRDDFVILFWNPQLEDWTGISKREIVGANIFARFPYLREPKYTDRFKDIFEGAPPAIFSAQLHKYIIPSPLPDGEFRIQHTVVIPVPVPDGTGFYALFAIQDVTELTRRIEDYSTMRDITIKEIKERKLAEEKLREYSVNLEKMIDERTLELQDALALQ